MTTKNLISLLPSTIAADVIKIDLDFVKAPGEVSRAIYYVPAGSFIKTHAPKDVSEIYINLFSIMNHKVGSLKAIPDVVGNNSPTGKHEHGVEVSQLPRVFLVIQRETKKDAWADLAESIITNKFQEWLKKLHFCGVLEKNILSLIFFDSTKNKQVFIDVDILTDLVSYLSCSKENVQDIHDETKSLRELQVKLHQTYSGVEK